MKYTVLALHCHPDDIEFTMAGTLFLLGRQGCALHYMNLANGSCGTEEYSAEEIIRIRGEEAEAAAKYLLAEYHPGMVNDIEVFYSDELIRRVAAVMRTVSPDILLLPSPEDYMEDHVNTSRIGVTAAFCRGMSNYHTIPDVPPVKNDVAVYHAMPHGLSDGMRKKIIPDFYINITDVIDNKQEMLAKHVSQKNWLDSSQGMDSYLKTMRNMSREVGAMSSLFEFAEGWRRHSFLGFARTDIDPLQALLSGYYAKNREE